MKMRIVHIDSFNIGSYIEVPNPDASFVPFDDNNALLVEYYVDKKKFINSHDKFAPLIRQMLYHDAFDESILHHCKNEILPNVTAIVSAKTIIACFDNGVKFTNDANDSATYLDYDTIEEIPYWEFINDKHLKKFTNLRRLDISNTQVTDDGIKRLLSLQSLNANNCVTITLEFIRKSKTRHPWCDGMLELMLDGVPVNRHVIRKFTKLKKLHMYSISVPSFKMKGTEKYTPGTVPNELLHPLCLSVEDLSMYNHEYLGYFRAIRKLETSDISSLKNEPSHPLFDTIEELKIEYVDSSVLERFRKLRILDIRNVEDFSFSFLTPTHSLCDSLEVLHGAKYMTDEGMEHLRNLRKLNAEDSDIRLNFLTPDHPMCESLTHLLTGGMIDDEQLRHLKSLKQYRGCPDDGVTFSFLTEDHPLCETMEDFDTGQMIDEKQVCMFRNLKRLYIDNCEISMKSLCPEGYIPSDYDSTDDESTDDVESAGKPKGEKLPLHFKSINTLEELYVDGCDSFIDENLRFLPHLKRLSLHIASSLEFLKENPRHPLVWSLKSLSMTRTKDVNSYIPPFQRLESIYTGYSNSLSIDKSSPLCWTVQQCYPLKSCEKILQNIRRKYRDSLNDW